MRWRLVVPAALALGCAHPQPPKMDPPMTIRELRMELPPEVRWTPEKVPAAQNGWDLAMKAASLCPGAPPGRRPGDPPPAPGSAEPTGNVYDILTSLYGPATADVMRRAQVHLAPYHGALAVLERALLRPRWLPEEASEDGIPDPDRGPHVLPFPMLMRFHELAYVLLVRARLELARNESRLAAADFMRAHALGRRVIEAHADMLALAIGTSIQSIADRAIQRAAKDPRLTIEDLGTVFAGLRPPAMGFDLVSTWRHHLETGTLTLLAGLRTDPKDISVLMLHTPDAVRRVLDGHPNAFDRRDAARRAGQTLRLAAEVATGPWPGKAAVDGLIPPDDLPRLPDSLSSTDNRVEPSSGDIAEARKALRNVDNPVGRLILAALPPVQVGGLVPDRRSLADLQATRVIVAAAMYRRVRGAEPPRLQALVTAGLLRQVPADPFGTGPLRYDPARRLIWSAGLDGTDHAGKGVLGKLAEGQDLLWPSDGVYPSGPAAKPATTAPPAGR